MDKTRKIRRLSTVEVLLDAPKVFVKQLGANPVGLKLKHSHGGDWSEWPEDLRVRDWPEMGTEFPEVRNA